MAKSVNLKEYVILGSNPIGRRITWDATGSQDLDRKVKKLKNDGYEVKVMEKKYPHQGRALPYNELREASRR